MSSEDFWFLARLQAKEQAETKPKTKKTAVPLILQLIATALMEML